jgi:ubiquinone/menaquinone biosynthesis C-methylase UbiE
MGPAKSLEYLKGLGFQTFHHFIDDSYDVVLSMDSIEHLKLEDAEKMIEEMKRIARKKVIIYTPTEFKDNIRKKSIELGIKNDIFFFMVFYFFIGRLFSLNLLFQTEGYFFQLS